MSYSPYYTGGWQTGETGGTPITPAALNHMESGIDANDAAIADNTEDITELANKIGNSSMGTTATTVTGAIAEHEGDITALNSNLSTTNGYIGSIRYTQHAVSGGATKNVNLETWAVYLVSTYQGFHIVFSGSSTATPVVSTVQNNSSLPVTGASNAKITLGNTTGSTYQFSVIRVL